MDRISDIGNIVLYHVGGGDLVFGPVEVLWNSLQDIEIIVFEIRDQAYEKTEISVNGKKIPLTKIGKCVYSSKGKKEFYVNKQTPSSSLLKPSQKAINEYLYFIGISWGQNTELDYILDVETDTIDNLIQTYNLPLPDVLSIDAQGAELDVMKGADKAFNNILCVQSEMQFHEIYENQPLFHDQFKILSDHKFRLMHMDSTQNLHPFFMTVGLTDPGFLTTAEPVFVRYDDLDELSMEQMLKLAEISFAFQRHCFSNLIIDKMIRKWPWIANEMKQSERYRKLIDIYFLPKIF
jgi:FkbM family methyltransferase